MAAQNFAGVLVPVLTPFTRSGEPDAGRFIDFCRFLLDQGADGLAIFGTTSEANSMSGAERMELLDRLIDAGIPAAKLMPGTGACSVTEAATLIRHAVGHGVGGVLMLPPFYYKGMDDDGLFAFFAGVIDRVGSDALRMYLYHIPPQTVLGLSLDLVGRLIEAYPRYRRRAQGQFRRLEQYRRAARPLPGFRGVPGLGGLPARRACARAPPAASPRPATSTCPASARSTRTGRRRRPTRCRQRSRPRARRSRPIRWCRR